MMGECLASFVTRKEIVCLFGRFHDFHSLFGRRGGGGSVVEGIM